MGKRLFRLLQRIQLCSRGIQARLVAIFLCLSLLPLAIAGGLAYQRGKASMQMGIGAQLEVRAQRILNGIEKFLTDGQSSLHNWAKLSVMYDLVGDDPDGRITGTLISLAREPSSLGQLMAISPKGIIVAASQPARIGERVANQPWFLRMHSQEVLATHPSSLRMLIPERDLFYYAAPVMSQGKAGHLIGYLAVALTRERLDKVIATTNDEQNSDIDDVYVMDKDGRILASRIRQTQGRVSQDEGSRFLQFLHAQPVASQGEHSSGWIVWSADRDERLTGYFQSPLGSAAGPTVVVFQSTEKTYLPIVALRNEIASIGVVLVCLVLLLSRIMAARLSKPINILTANAEAVAAGRFNTVDLPLSREDEIGSLARAFGRMTQELKILTVRLEERVQERTAALDNSYRSLQQQIREREVAEAVARASEQRFHQMVSQVKDYAIIMIEPKGVVIEWNEGAERIMGYGTEEIIGKPLFCFYLDEDVKAGKPERLLAHAVEHGSVEDQGWRVRKDGSRFWAQVVMTAVHDTQGCLIGFSKLTRDLSAQKVAEEEKQSLEGQLLQAQKMEAIGRLAGGIAHDFNNLLTVITGYCQMALMGLQPNQPLFLPLQEISKAADRAANLTMQLLAFSRKQVLQPTTLVLNEVVVELGPLLRQLIGEDIQLETVCAKDLESVLVDRGQMEQIMMNLAINAKDAMPKGGRLMIRTGIAWFTPSRPEATGIVPEGCYVKLEVLDTGCGMDEETKKRVFEPFFTTKEVGKGTGLGLSTVYGIVKQSNGYVTVVSEPGKGALFTVYFRPVKKASDGATQAEAVQLEPAAQVCAATILLVEDESSIRRLLQGLLMSKGYKVLTAPDGEAGLGLGNSFSGLIDLLVTDVVMPKLNGADMAKHLMVKYPRLKVLYMSGYTDESIVQHGVLEPGIAFLSKPFKPQVLLERVQQVLKT